MRMAAVALMLASSCLYVETTGDPGKPRLQLECSMTATCSNGEHATWTQRWCGTEEEAGLECLATSLELDDMCTCVTACRPAGLCAD